MKIWNKIKCFFCGHKYVANYDSTTDILDYKILNIITVKFMCKRCLKMFKLR